MHGTNITKVADFDNYDQALLYSALKAGRLFAKVVDGPEGSWVSAVSQEDPVDEIDRNEHPFRQSDPSGRDRRS